MKAKTIGGTVVTCIAVALTTTAVFAAVGLVLPRSTKTPKGGATTITWDSCFADPDYTLGNTIAFTVNWDIDAGAASYVGFGLKTNPKGKGGFTPRGRDPVAGTSPTVTYPGSYGADSVDVSFKFTELHLDREPDPDVKIGNAHFKLLLKVDVDGDGTPETDAGFGVNVHVEDQQ